LANILPDVLANELPNVLNVAFAVVNDPDVIGDEGVYGGSHESGGSYRH
jgi:hypothetical protein